MNFKQTPSQTVGPYFAYGLTPEQYGFEFKSLATNILTEIEAVTIRGIVYDGEGNPIPDALIEIWDANHKLFGRFGTGTEPDSSFMFNTLKPSSINGSAPFLTVILFMRGQMIHSYTRIYFPDEKTNNTDSVLSQIPKERKHTLIAVKTEEGYQFDIYMQGEKETVFFDV
jgi:protocatechuate 3,4-dioxygenase alpha subunit